MSDDLENEELLWLIREEFAGRKVYRLTTAADHRERARQLRGIGQPETERAREMSRSSGGSDRALAGR